MPNRRHVVSKKRRSKKVPECKELKEFKRLLLKFGKALSNKSTINVNFIKEHEEAINQVADAIGILYKQEGVSFDKGVFKDLVKSAYAGMSHEKKGGMFRRPVGSISRRHSLHAMAGQEVVPLQRSRSSRSQGFFGRVVSMWPDLLAILTFLASIYFIYLAYCKMDDLVKSIQVGNQASLSEMSGVMVEEIKRVFADLKIREMGFLKFMYTGLTTFSCNLYSNLQSSLNESLILVLKASSKEIAEGARTYCIGSDGSWTEWISSVSDVGATAQCIATVSSNEALGLMQRGLLNLNNLLAKTNMTTAQVRSLLQYGSNGLITSGGYFLARVGYSRVISQDQFLENGSQWMEIGNGEEEERQGHTSPRRSSRSNVLRIGNGDEYGSSRRGTSTARFEGGERFSMRSTQKRRM